LARTQVKFTGTFYCRLEYSVIIITVAFVVVVMRWTKNVIFVVCTKNCVLNNVYTNRI
jgi:hypothetical protein